VWSTASPWAWEAAIEASPNRKVQAEVGYLLLDRAGVDPLPLCESDFSGHLFSWGDDEFIPKADIIEDLRGGPRSVPPDGLIRLAIRAYGAAWSQASPYGPRAWGRLIILDGLRVAFCCLG
jgi:hypothetical protein